MKKCPYCDFESKNDKSVAGHISVCKDNPNLNSKERNRKLSESMIKFNKIKYPKIKLKLKLKCLNCGVVYKIETIESKFKRGKYQKCCSKDCAHKYTSSKNDKNRIKKAFCKNCNDEIEIKINASVENVLCDVCRNKYEKIRKKIFNRLRNHKDEKSITEEYKKSLLKCDCCGQEICQKPEICKKVKLIPGLVKRFGFNKEKIGNLDFYEEFERIKNNLIDDYHIKELSLPEICVKYNHNNNRNLSKILESLGIKRRTLSESNKVSIKKGKIKIPHKLYPYKCGFHKTWEGKEIFFRSSYEENYCKELDKKRIKYDVEKIRIQYYDTQKETIRTAIPDFHIIDDNEIVEIKSDWTYDEQNMKDKFKAYKENGYKVKLLLEGKETII